MATVSVPPVIPKTVSRGDPAGSPRRVRRPLPVPALADPPPEAGPTVYALSAVDQSGRVADRSVVRALGWSPGTRLDIREHDGLITIRSAADGVHVIDVRGYLHLPLAARPRILRIDVLDILGFEPPQPLLPSEERRHVGWVDTRYVAGKLPDGVDPAGGADVTRATKRWRPTARQ